MRGTIKQLLRKHLKIDVRRYGPRNDEFLRLAAMLDANRVRLVLDVGANEGQFATALRKAGYLGEIFSFEPLADAHAVLTDRAGGQWRVAPRVALSDSDGTASFEVASNSVSSSLLRITEACRDAAPQAAAKITIDVPTRRLDSLWTELNLYGPAFLKIDTQGAEGLVLAGAGDLLSGPIVGVQAELGLVELYRGQILAPGIDEMLRGLGYRCADIIPGLREAKSHALLEYDGVYFRD
jgi:FkbM family methyltransferase